MAPTITVLTLGEWLAVFDIVVIGATPCTKEDIMAGVIGPEVIKMNVGMIDLVVGHMGEGRHAVNDPEGNARVGIGIT